MLDIITPAYKAEHFYDIYIKTFFVLYSTTCICNLKKYLYEIYKTL
jgi:hypothetical protein